MRIAYRILVRKPEGKRSLKKPKCRWEGNIKMGLSIGGVDWIHLAQYRNHL
jgi:hypothetical protein